MQSWIAPIVFIVLTLIACGTAIVSGAYVLAAPGTDLSLQFLAWRQFGFSELSHGNLALWNPHIFGGAPYFAGFQSALLYPPNWFHLVLPLARAINLLIALHVFAAGYFTYLWCRRRAGIAGSILGGTMFMLCGPFFLHIYAGHLPHIAVIVWIPLILLSIDGLVESGDVKWCLLGAITIAMQIFAGHPQYVYYTGIVATIYAIALIATRSPTHVSRAGVGICFVAMYAGAIGLSAIQLFAGLALTGESIRSGGLSYGMAGTFSLPPENFLTLLLSNIFGALPKPEDVADAAQHYFGRAYLWETSLFVSISGFLLATFGAITMTSKRLRWALIGTLLACIVLALGRHTPLYWVMYRFVPKYGSFRGTVKFLAPAAAIVSMLAAIGFDRLLAGISLKTLAVWTTAFAIVLALFALTIERSSHSGWNGIWGGLLGEIAESGTNGEDNEMFVDVPHWAYAHFGFIRLTGHAAAMRLFGASVVTAILAGIFFATRWRREIAFVVLPLAAIELLIFAYGAKAATLATVDLPQPWQENVARAPRDVRFLITDPPDVNSPMYFGFNGVWGYDPGVLKRYAELVTFSQGGDPDQATQYVSWRQRSDNIFQMLRVRAIFQRNPNQPVVEIPGGLPIASLIRNYDVMTDRDDVLRNLASPIFDPRSRVILEAEPKYIPAKGNSIGEVEVVAMSTDSLDLRVDIETPAILLITNNFADGWRARALQAGPQPEYIIQPANWTQQAIALAAGRHRIRLEYVPTSYRIGRWVSVLSMLGIALAAALLWRRRAATQ